MILRPAVALPLVMAAIGCSDPDLGDAPFFCNNGTPECPSGYQCVRAASGDRICLRKGASLPGADVGPTRPDGGAADLRVEPDTSIYVDGPMPDRGTTPDVRWPDQGPPADVWVPPDQAPTPDQGHLGCQSNAECTDPDAPCCCPMPFVPLLWDCLPLCFDPFCI